MAKNKKKVSVANRTDKPPVTSNNDAPSDAPPTRRSGLSSPQFCGLVFLAVGVMCLLELRAILRSKNCNAYLIDSTQVCTESDVIMVQAKYYFGILSGVLVAACMLICWNDAPSLHRLNALLCSSPLVTTLAAMNATQHMVDPSHLLKLGMLVAVLLILAALSIRSTSAIAERLPLSLDLQNATLLTIMVTYAWETYKFLTAGVPGFLRVTETTPASLALLPFLAVDQSTIVGLCLFGIAYLRDNDKRALLMCIAMSQCAGRLYIVPLLKDSLAEPEYYDNLYYGCAMSTAVACIAPRITLFKEPTITEEEADGGELKKDE